MPHPVVYPGNMNALIKEWDEKYKQAWKENRQAGLDALMIANGQCARLPQELTSVGYSGTWQRGDRVIDVARTLRPGTVIANFNLIDGKWQYPRGTASQVHGHHAALFITADSFSTTTGKPGRIQMFDQWRGERPKAPGPRWVNVWPEPSAKKPCDKADEFYVVLVP
jgi:hypothetical protein